MSSDDFKKSSFPQLAASLFIFRLPLVFSLVALGLVATLAAYGLEIEPQEQSILRKISLVGVGLWGLRTIITNWRDRSVKAWPHFILAIWVVIEVAALSISDHGIIQHISPGDLGLIDNLLLLSVNFAVAVSLGFEILECTKLGLRMITNHARTFLYLFLMLLFSGTVALLMPGMSAGAASLHLSDAFFTAAGASTLTSLSTILPSQLSIQGQVVQLVLMQCAVMLVLGYAAFLFVKFKQNKIENDFADVTLINSSEDVVKRVFAWLLALEIVAAVFLFGLWDAGVKFSGNGEKLFSSLFHSVSAVSNSGLSTFEEGLTTSSTLRHNYLAHWLLMGLAFVGSIGFIALLDLFSRKSIKARLANSKLRLAPSTRVVVYGSIGIIVLGAVVFYLTESSGNGLLEHQNSFGGITTCLFQSTMKLSGFQTSVDWNRLWWIDLALLITLGGSLLGSGGGLRIENIARMVRSNFLSGFGSVKKMLLITLVWNILAVGLLYFTESHIIDNPRWGMDVVIFEQLSAFFNSGHSAGITSQLSLAGQMIVIMSMFVGRVSFLFIIGRAMIKMTHYN